MSAVAVRVERWTPVSLGFTTGLGVLIGLLALGPFVLGGNSLDNLIQLYFLVILAIMWNALAGYGGLVSVGQQAFIGIGAYAVVFLSVQHSLNPYLSMLLATLIGGAVAIPVAAIVLWLRAGAFAIATWVVAEIFAILVSLDAALGGGTGSHWSRQIRSVWQMPLAAISTRTSSGRSSPSSSSSIVNGSPLSSTTAARIFILPSAAGSRRAGAAARSATGPCPRSRAAGAARRRSRSTRA